MQVREIVSPDELLRRAEAIKALSLSEPFKWLVDSARRECFAEWEKAATADAREAAHQRLLGVQSIEKQVQKIIDAGVRTAHAIEQERKKAEQKK
jgi:hypothetical protein